MLLLFGGQREDQRGALEREVVEATLVPSLDANNVREALRDMEREALLYLHHRGARYRFDTVANINSLIRGEREGLSVEEVLARVRAELERGLQQGADRHEIVVWPDTSAQVRDDGGRFRIVYLPPDWSSANMPLGAAVLTHGTAQRVYRNGLAFARPVGATFDAARQAARTLMAIERLLAAGRVSLTREQRDDLSERTNDARRELAGTLPGAYDAVLVPRGPGERGEIAFDTVELTTVLAAGRGLHQRVHDALEMVVFDRLTASKLAAIARLDENGFAWCERLADDFFRFFERPKLWSTDVVGAAIADGVSNGVFAYATGAREEEGRITLESPAALRLHTAMRAEAVDLGPSAVLLSLSTAEALHPATTTQPGAPGTLQPPSTPDPTTPAAPRPAGAASVVHIELRATEDDLHTLQRALSALRDLVRPGHLRISVTVAASTDGSPIDKVAFANRVQEPLDEDPDVEVIAVRWEDERPSGG